ncbi:hypothetical protein [Acinetobacter baumannii]|uniref:hypothetical protein n=1 Tax=Acinetobacter baumannii TaxID=470 RepID=UPI00189C25F3|nr:hypothetical protein [Acinetobacter baumannii]MBF6792161.1 hypothetical protein [Acinetobacter baumannii]HBI1351833.1 hypothetical protein [Acinetobacter baumannii]
MEAYVDQIVVTKDQAKKAWVNGERVFFRDCADSLYSEWTDITNKDAGFKVTDFDVGYEFCVRPNTISFFGVEIPAPIQPEEGQIVWSLGNYHSDDLEYECFYWEKNAKPFLGLVWSSEELIKQVVSALYMGFGVNK